MRLRIKCISNRGDEDAVKHSFLQCVTLMFVITAVWSITCISKGLWPFGQNVLDIEDMMEQCVPVYTHLWDVLHGKKSLLFDWNTGYGNNMAGVVLHFGLISPFNLFFLFVKRSAIEASMSIYILIKLIAIGYSMRFLLRKWFPSLSGWISCSFSLLYVFSVFNMQYYFAVMWLDVSFMFPLIMYGYFLLMNEKRSMPYIISLAVACMMSFQHTYMIFLILLLLTGLLPLLSRERYQNKLIRLFTATMIAVMLASWILIPGSLQIMQAGRLSANNGLIGIWNSVWIFYTAKWMKLLNLGIPLSLYLIYSIKNFKQKDTRFFCAVIALLCAPIVLESTNLLWHGGSYEGYTIRFAYMITFWILVAGAYAYDRGLLPVWIVPGQKVSRIIGIFSLVLSVTMTVIQYFMFKAGGYSVYKTEISAIVIIFIVIISVIAGGGLLFNDKKYYERFALLLTICSAAVLAMNSIFISGTKENTYISMLNKATENSGSENGNSPTENPLDRIKSLDVSLSHNYPLILNKNAVSNYLAINSYRQMGEINRMGYAKVGFRLSDYGGTLFTDALLGVSETISSLDVNESLYRYENSYGDYNIYKCLYGYEQGIKIHGDSWEKDASADTPFIHQNQIAKAVLGKELLEIITASGNEMRVEIEEESVLYLYSKQEESFEAVVVTNLNTGEENILELSESGWMNGILELGMWGGVRENASLQIRILSNEQVGEVSCAILPLQDFINYEPDYFNHYTVVSKADALYISLEDAEEGDYLFLPVYHDDGWKCIVNHQKTELKEFADYFILIPLHTGKNEITLSFTPTGFILGVLLTLSGVLLMAVTCKYPLKMEWENANHVLLVLDEFVFGILMLMFYIVPICFLIKVVAQAALSAITG